MAYDSAKLKTIKWLEKLCFEKRSYIKFQMSDRLKGIFARFGRMYATDGVIVVYVEYPENSNAGAYEWEELTSYTDENGYLKPVLQFEEMEKPFLSDEFFQTYFPKPTEYCTWEDTPRINPSVIEFALKPFKINKINPYFAFTPQKLVLSGHNRDVSLMVCIMGVNDIPNGVDMLGGSVNYSAYDGS